MWEFVIETIVWGSLEWATEFAPRPIRIGCMALLLVAAAGLLTWLFWPRQ